MKKLKCCESNKGFSLVEVLLAIVILGIIAVPILQMFFSSYKINEKSKRMLTAAELAQTTIEALSSQTYDENVTIKGTHVADGLGQQEKLYKLLQDDPCIISELRIEDWLYYISNAEFVLTDSFHGFCFSLIFHKQAIGYVNAHRGKARFDSIGELADVEERIVESFEQLKQRELWTKAIDYTRVEEKLVPMREFSRNWLKNALTARRNAPSSKELQLWKTLEHDRKIYEQAEEIKRLRQLVEQQGAEIKKLLDQH